ncbi:glycosyltransferase [Aureitalea sp. L0-47]|uniref:glycosyltransferase n=1 Tax=Aureitalea sp. L0-47 TaxID=2816962 RepID=UPI002238C076|nr:glycosyltransferase [Aureitalea sp. L0-47]MCW5520691.1 glycosyltransferase [Aureitalea sp. L0-47]
MISILIPTYNYDTTPLVQNLLDQAKSLKQSVEILVFDDGSINFREENTKNGESEQVTYQYFENNTGRSAIRQKLAEQASHDLLLFLDADVLPESSNFLEKYVKTANDGTMVLCGGVTYDSTPPSEDKMLRYVYGKEREAKSAAVRSIEPYIIVTANMLIQKDLFLKINEDLTNFYGEDLLISWNLKKLGVNVSHIDNPVVHLGLEESANFLEKARSAITNIVRLEKEGKIGEDFISLQRAYGKLKRFGGLGLFHWIMRRMNQRIRANALSHRPSMFYFNLLRLSHYAELKKNG